MLGLSAVAVASAIILSWMRLDPQNTSMLLTMCILLGGTLNAVQTTMYALAVNVYPTEIRGTGLGTCLAVGRVGNVLAAYVGNFALDRGGGVFLGVRHRDGCGVRGAGRCAPAHWNQGGHGGPWRVN
jgi:hypothetical protein